MLDFDEFSAMVRSREEGDFTEEQLRERFNELDADGSGKVDMAEYLQWSLREALARSSDRVVDLFKKWDEDNSGKIDKTEFTRAIRSLGFGDISENAKLKRLLNRNDKAATPSSAPISPGESGIAYTAHSSGASACCAFNCDMDPSMNLFLRTGYDPNEDD